MEQTLREEFDDLVKSMVGLHRRGKSEVAREELQAWLDCRLDLSGSIQEGDWVERVEFVGLLSNILVHNINNGQPLGVNLFVLLSAAMRVGYLLGIDEQCSVLEDLNSHPTAEEFLRES